MKGENFLQRLLERIRRRLVQPSQPLLKLPKHPLGISVTVLLQSRSKASMGLLPPPLGQMALNIAVLMDRTSLVNQPTAEALP